MVPPPRIPAVETPEREIGSMEAIDNNGGWPLTMA
jgi:hypothetical protein